MSKAISFARSIAADPVDGLRMVIVIACAMALIMAGRVLPIG